MRIRQFAVGANCRACAATCALAGTGSPGASPPPAVRLVTISAGGVAPQEVQTAVGTRVMFINNDTIAHDIMGGPDPTRPDCHEIDSVGFLSPGQSRQTAPFAQARLCEYHDHSFHSTLFNGRILIQ